MFFFFISMFCSQKLTLKLNLRSNTDPAHEISIVKRFFFFNFYLRKYFLLFFADFWPGLGCKGQSRHTIISTLTEKPK